MSDLFSLLQEVYSSQIKGETGEMTVDYLLSKLDKDYYLYANNILLPLKNGGTTQIDHLVLSCYGIFVIETKNYQGFIFGDEVQDYWIQKTYGGTYRIFNPIKQNDIHINVLSNLLGLDKSYFYSIIVFVGDYQLKTALPNYVIVCDFFHNNLNAYIQSKNTIKMSSELCVNIANKIGEYALQNSAKNEQQHQQYVQGRQNLCPRCRSEMVERVAKKTGKKFFGCRNFPRCRGTRPSEEEIELKNTLKEFHKLLMM